MEQAQVTSHSIFLTARRITNIVNSVRFRTAWEHADVEERKKINALIKEQDEHKIMLWFDEHAPLLTFKDLFNMARKHFIPNYSRMTKYDLLSVLLKEGIIKENQL